MESEAEKSILLLVCVPVWRVSFISKIIMNNIQKSQIWDEKKGGSHTLQILLLDI